MKTTKQEITIQAKEPDLNFNCIAVPTNQDKLALQDFIQRINKEPDPKNLVDTADRKAKTVSISSIEMLLDEFFFGQWDLVNVTFEQIFNEIAGTGELVCVHPVTGREIRRTGFASIVITQDAGSAVTDFNTTKKKNALDLSFPKLKSEILKNAAQSLGKVFGRDLNRRVKDEYTPQVKVLSESTMQDILTAIDKGADLQDAIRKVQAMYSLTEDQLNQLTAYQPKQLSA